MTPFIGYSVSEIYDNLKRDYQTSRGEPSTTAKEHLMRLAEEIDKENKKSAHKTE